MASSMTRRPLPALVGLVALLVLTGIVWWRVANRDTDSAAAPPGSPTKVCAGAPSSGRAQAPPTVAPEAVTVRVLNSTDRGGLAGKVRRTLLGDGFRIPDPAADDSATASISAPAEIRYAKASSSAHGGARLLAYYFPGAALKVVDGSSATVTVSLGTGFKSVASASSVKAALAKASASASAAPGSSTPGSSTPSC